MKDVSVAQAHLVPDSRSLTCKSRENEGCLNVVGHCVVIVTHIFVVLCVLASFPFRHELRWRPGCNVRQNTLAKCEALSGTGCELVTGQSCDKRVLNHCSPQVGVDFAPGEVEHHGDQEVASSVKVLEESFQVWCGNVCKGHMSV